MRLLFRFLLEQKRVLLIALGLATINQFFSLLDPQIFRILIDEYVMRVEAYTQSEFIRGVGVLLLGIIGVAFVSRVAKSFQDYYVTATTQRVGTKMYADSIDHAFSLPFFVFEDQRSGELLQKLQKARLDVQTLIGNFVNVVFLASVGMVFVLVYSFSIHWLIGLTYAVVIPTVATTTYLISRRLKAIQRRIVAQKAELAGSTTETLRNVEMVRSLGLDSQETQRLNQVNEQILVLELEKVRLVRKLEFVRGTTINALRTTILFSMLWLLFKGQLTAGQFFSLYSYSFFIFFPLQELGSVIHSYQEAQASMELVQKLFSTPAETRPEHPRSVERLERVEFKGVSFGYASQAHRAVHDINFSLEKGQTIAFVGPSGAGKTTVLKLLVALYQPNQGAISINGISGIELDQRSFRQRIGYVSQETQLFAGTIRENLLFVAPGASDEECFSALEQAAALSLVERGGKGLDTKIGEGGIKISGGERQRLAIARALLRKPDLLIFDEATSSLDSLTERSITETIQGISKKSKNLMTVLVAHRLSTVAHADTIYVLEKGGVAEKGTHAALLKKKGLYYALWREQSAVRDSLTSEQK